MPPSLRQNLFTTLGRVFTRRRVSYITVFEDSVANIKASNGTFGNSTTHQWSEPYDCSEYAECIITLANLAGSSWGSITTLQMMVQTYNAKNQQWLNLLSSAVSAYSGTTSAETGLLAYVLAAPIGGLLRVGLTCVNTSTNDGLIDIELQLKG